MKQILTLLTAFAALTLGACVNSSGGYSVKAYAPKNPAAVRVKVSTSTQNIYVVEGDRVLMAVQGTVGVNGSTGSGQTPREPAGRRIPDGILVRVEARLWFPRRLRPPAPAQPRLHPDAS